MLKQTLNQFPTLKEFLVKIHLSLTAFKNRPTKRALLKKIWQERALYRAPTIEGSERSLTRGNCYFFKDLTALDSFKYKKIAIVGGHSYQQKIEKSLRKRFPDLEIDGLKNPTVALAPKEVALYEAVIVSAHEVQAISLLRLLLATLQFPGDLILEGSSSHQVIPTKDLESKQPIVVCAYPCAGTNRFIFGFEYLMNKLKWEGAAFSPFVRNVRYLQSLSDKARDTDIDHAFFWKIQTMDHFQWLNTHEYFSLSAVKDLDCRFVVLMRDPRDIINSFYWHTLDEAVDKKNHIHQILDGYTRFSGANYAFNWPSAAKIVDNFLIAQKSSNFYVIRFEDLHRNEVEAFKDLFQRLKLYPHPFIEIGESDFKHAAYLGSFEYQTGGKMRRGQKSLGRLGGEHSGVSCRKGVVGDWRSSFTPEAVEHFKTLVGDKLIELGYETNANWGIL